MAEMSLDRPLSGLSCSNGFATRRLGSTRMPDGRCEFCVWAPQAKKVAVRMIDKSNECLELSPEPHGYHYGATEGLSSNARYRYLLDGGKERSDPASRFQPEGVYGPSQIDDGQNFPWED